MLRPFFFWAYLYTVGAFATVKSILFDRHRRLKASDLKDMTGKTVVVTGGNRGIGLETVKKLLSLGCRVVVGCRDPERALDGVRQAMAETGQDDKVANVKALPLDLKSMASVRKFAESVKQECGKVHVLINNAGIMFAPYEVTRDGFESQMATNYLGHFLLTSLLLDKLKATADEDRSDPVRVVNVSSVAHHLGAWMDFDKIGNKYSSSQDYSPHEAYGLSKMAQVLFTKEMNAILRSEGRFDILVNCVHPGVVQTDLYTHTTCNSILKWIRYPIMDTPEQGADTVLYAAISPEIESGGLYLENSHVATPSSFARDEGNSKRLWDATLKALKIPSFGNDSG